MAPSLFKSLLVAGALSSVVLSEPAPKFVRIPVTKAKRHHILNEAQRAFLEKRQEPFEETLANELPQGHSTYLATIGVGTPPQNISLVLDTGSSDIWMFGKGTCPRANAGCGGTYDISASTSAVDLPRYKGLFEIEYGDGSKVQGDYFRDNIDVGGVSVPGLTMAVATRAQISSNTGVMGIGYRLNEASASLHGVTYDNIMDVMINDNLVSSRTYSLYLNGQQATEGQIIFGGYDSSRWQGNLQVVPIVPDSNGQYSTFSVVWSSVGLTQPDGKSLVLQTSTLPLPVLLDSGSSLAALPSDILSALASEFQAQAVGDGSYAVPCSIRDQNGSLNFGFQGDGGPVIAVPFSELAIPIYDSNGQQRSQSTCLFGFQDATDGIYVFGDTILRSAYIAYDLDNNVVGLAQTVLNHGTDTNFQEIPSSGVPAIPNATMAPDTQVPQFASPTPSIASGYDYGYPIGGYLSGYGYGSSGIPTPVASNSNSASFAAVATSYTNIFNPTGSAGAGPPANAGSRNGPGAAALLSVASLSAVMMVFGAAVLLL